MKLTRHLRRWLAPAITTALLTATMGAAWAQTAGDYRSAATGDWNAASTWEEFDGVSWNPAATSPTSADGAISIRNGHVVTISVKGLTYDQVVVDAGGQVTVTAASTFTGTVASGATLATAATLTNSGTLNVNGKFQINSGGFGTGTNFTYSATGELVFNNSTGSYGVNDDAYWPAASGPLNITVQGASGITMNVARAVSGLFQTAAEVTNGNNLTLNGTAQINPGGFFVGSPTYGGSSTLKYNTGGSYGRGDEWTATSGAGYPNNVQLSSNTTLDLGNGATGTARQCAGDLTIDVGSELTMNNGGNAMSAALTVLQDFNLFGTLTLSSLIGGDLVLGGNWTSASTFNSNNRAVFFNGSSAQSITGSTVFDYVILNNASGLTINNDDTINQTLTLTNGKITAGANTLTIGPSGSITGASSTRYVYGKLKKRVTILGGAGSQTWEVGDAAIYAPVNLVTTTGTQNFDATVSTQPGDHPNIGTSGLDTAKTINRFYSVSSTPGGSFTNANLTFHFDPTDVDGGANTNNFVVKKYDSPTWTSPGVGTRTATSTQATGVTGFSDFQIGELVPPEISINDTAQPEGNTGTTTLSFTVTLSAVSADVVTVQYATGDGTATTANGDYVTESGVATFNIGETTKPVTVDANGDITNESNETFTVNLTSPTNATIADAQGLGTILNDDAVPGLAINDVSVAEGNAGTTTATFTVSLSAPTDQAVTVSYATANGSATTANGDYAAAAGMLTFQAKSTVPQTIVVQVNGDITNEANETFTVILARPTNATIADAQGMGTILNDDDAIAPVVAVMDPNGGESIVIGQALELVWTASDDVGVTTVDLHLSRDGGSNFEVVALGEPNDGSLFWTVTGPATTQALLRVVARDAAGNTGSDLSDAVWTIFVRSNDVEDEIVHKFALTRVAPNPAARQAGIDYAVAREAKVRISVVDLQGRSVALLVDGVQPAGRYRAVWNPEAGKVPAGIYLVRYQALGRTYVKRLAVTR